MPSTCASASVPASRSASTAVLEMNVTPYPASTARPHRLLQARARAARRGRAAARPGGASASSTIWRTPAPSCIRIERLLAQLVERDRAAREAVPGRAGEDDLVGEERLEADAAVPPGRRRRSRARARGSATRSTTACVSETVRKTRTPGCSRWNSQRRTGTAIAAGPVDAPSTRSPASSPSDVAATSETI